MVAAPSDLTAQVADSDLTVIPWGNTSVPKVVFLRNMLPSADFYPNSVQDETRRLGRITQGLLTGGDVVRAEIQGEVPLAAVVERARALVFAGMRRAPPVEIGEARPRLLLALGPPGRLA